MRGLLVDTGLRGHRLVLDGLFHQPQRIELWQSLACDLPSFEDLGLAHDSSDLVVWQACQNRQFLLLTANRNEKGKESLETVIHAYGRPDSLPVLTFADPAGFMSHVEYRHKVADKILEYLFDIDRHLGTGRLWVP